MNWKYLCQYVLQLKISAVSTCFTIIKIFSVSARLCFILYDSGY